jgi:hypothetical protein
VEGRNGKFPLQAPSLESSQECAKFRYDALSLRDVPKAARHISKAIYGGFAFASSQSFGPVGRSVGEAIATSINGQYFCKGECLLLSNIASASLYVRDTDSETSLEWRFT